MTGRLEELKSLRDQLKGSEAERLLLEEKLNNAKERLKEEQEKLEHALEAQEFINTIALAVQKTIEYHVNNLVSFALAVVWDDPYTFELEFDTARDQTEGYLWFIRGGNKVHPMMSSGGGPKDIAAYALIVASYNIDINKPRPFFLMDQPFANVSDDLQERVSMMVKAISDTLGIQQLIISHKEGISSHGDRVFEFSLKKGVTMVKRIGETIKKKIERVRR